MYKRRITALALATIMTASVFTGCAGKKSAQTSATPVSEKDKYAKEIKVTAARSSKDIVQADNNLLAKALKEKFNLVIETTDIPSNDYVTKMSMLFASGEPPEFIYNLRPEYKLSEWTNGGYLKGFSTDEIKKNFPNYMTKVFDDKEWPSVYSLLKNTDNKLYYFPGHRPDKANMAWTYREDTMKSLNLSYPKTTDELYNVLKKIKDSTGRIPYVSANAGGQCLWAFSGFMQSFGMPELAIRELSYVDPVSKKFVPYAFSENNYRDFLKYMNKLYKDGLIWKEFATATTDQTKKFQTQGNGYVLWGYPAKIAEYNNISKTADPQASWSWAKDMPTAFSDRTYYKREPAYVADGCGFSSNASDEQVSRMFDYLNWACTEEGQTLHTYGVEGVTYQKNKDGKLEYKDNMITPTRATGDKAGKYGINGSNGFMITHPDIRTVYTPIVLEVEGAFLNKDKYYYFTSPAMPFTDDENKKLADITTSINDTRDEYAARFIMGQLDPNNDADWNKYVDTLKKLGLDNFNKIRTDAYTRGTK